MEYDNFTDEEKEIVQKLYFEADDYRASREWILDYSGGSYYDITGLVEMGWLENIGKNDDGDDVFELTEKALKEIKDNFSKIERDYKIEDGI